MVDRDEVKAGAAGSPAEAQFMSKFNLTVHAAAGEGSKKQRTCDKCGKASRAMQKPAWSLCITAALVSIP